MVCQSHPTRCCIFGGVIFDLWPWWSGLGVCIIVAEVLVLLTCVICLLLLSTGSAWAGQARFGCSAWWRLSLGHVCKQQVTRWLAQPCRAPVLPEPLWSTCSIHGFGGWAPGQQGGCGASRVGHLGGRGEAQWQSASGIGRLLVTFNSAVV